MSRVRPAAWLLVPLVLLACQSRAPEKATSSAEASAAPSAAAAPAGVEKFGDPIQQRTATPLATVLAAPESYANRTVTVEGDVRRACSRKGCWLELAQGSGTDAPSCRVTFKDYGFFVPTNSAGAKARVEARVETEVIPKGHVSHLEEEGARFADKRPDGTAREVRLVASGVELWRG